MKNKRLSKARSLVDVLFLIISIITLAVMAIRFTDISRIIVISTMIIFIIVLFFIIKTITMQTKQNLFENNEKSNDNNGKSIHTRVNKSLMYKIGIISLFIATLSLLFGPGLMKSGLNSLSPIEILIIGFTILILILAIIRIMQSSMRGNSVLGKSVKSEILLEDYILLKSHKLNCPYCGARLNIVNGQQETKNEISRQIGGDFIIGSEYEKKIYLRCIKCKREMSIEEYKKKMG